VLVFLSVFSSLSSFLVDAYFVSLSYHFVGGRRVSLTIPQKLSASSVGIYRCTPFPAVFTQRKKDFRGANPRTFSWHRQPCSIFRECDYVPRPLYSILRLRDGVAPLQPARVDQIDEMAGRIHRCFAHPEPGFLQPHPSPLASRLRARRGTDLDSRDCWCP